MARVHVFADESGNFDFKRSPGASKYFLLTTVTANDCSVGAALQELRRELAWEGIGLDKEFHATTDKQTVRDRVFQVLAAHDFRVDATLLEKSKSLPKLRSSETNFYKYAWWLHMKHLAPKIARPNDELLVVGASIGVKADRSIFYGAVRDVIQQVSPTLNYRVGFCPAAGDPCLQVADYCAWAIQRKWESQDPRSHVLIENKIRSEFDVFRFGATHHY